MDQDICLQGRWDQLLQNLTVSGEPVVDLLLHPWDLHAHLEVTLRDDLLASGLPAYTSGVATIVTAGSHPIKAAGSAKLHPMVVINAEKGPVVIDEHAVIGSFAVVAGPCYIGPGTIIAPHTHLRANTSIAGSCVIGGEVSAAVIDQCTNKSHTGYLGNAIVGQWVNLGADTNASNLKNTYGHVRMTLERDGQPHDSGLTKLGPVIGDFVRTAIGSSIMTGSCIGTGSMLALSSFAPKFVDRFRFVTDQGDQPYDIEKFLQTARQMTRRRRMELPAAMEARLRELAQSTMVV
jgi:UDP-N-acetylglucosamine diphosphorylase/glucosamine-1-phosphate N-acetyltransferase